MDEEGGASMQGQLSITSALTNFTEYDVIDSMLDDNSYVSTLLSDIKVIPEKSVFTCEVEAIRFKRTASL